MAVSHNSPQRQLLLLLLSHFSCVQLCATPDSSPPGSPVPGILQARTLEWVAISFSNAWKRKVKEKSLSHVRLLATPWTAAYQAPPSMGFSRQEYWSGVPLTTAEVSRRTMVPEAKQTRVHACAWFTEGNKALWASVSTYIQYGQHTRLLFCATMLIILESAMVGIFTDKRHKRINKCYRLRLSC